MFNPRNIAWATVAGMILSIGVAGCQPERPDVVPSSAQMWASGNQMMHYQAPADGTVYVFDKTAQRLLWSGRIYKGESVDVDTQKGLIESGGNVVMNKLAAPLDQKDIYFDPMPIQTPVINNANNNGVTVTPNVSVQPSNGNTTSNGVTVQPGVTVTPAPNP